MNYNAITLGKCENIESRGTQVRAKGVSFYDHEWMNINYLI